MMTSFWADYLSIKSSLCQRIVLSLIVGAVVGVSCGDAGIVPAMVVFMTAIQIVFTLVAYDEMNGWEGFRCTMPLSRSDVYLGRMLFILACTGFFTLVGVAAALLVAAASPLVANLLPGFASTIAFDAAGTAVGTAGALMALLLMLAFIMPFIAKYGATQAIRVIPVACALLFVVGVAVCGFDLGGAFSGIDALLAGVHPVVVSVGMLSVGLLVYGASAFVSAGIYERREF